MQNFVYHNPTKVLFGRDTIKNIGPESLLWGKKALLVFGSGSIKKNGIYDQVISSLAQAGVDVILHGGVKSNPVLSHVRQGITTAQKNNIDVVVAVGGGSVIDSAKAICAGIPVAHDVWKFFTGKKSIKQMVPLTTVLTLAAAGSEMNSGMVITNDETGDKFGTGNKHLYPKTSILDPETTYSVPPDYTAYGAVDAISHVLEFYMTTRDPSTPVQDRLMEGLIVNAMDSCNRCLANGHDYQARADLMWTATLALNGLTAAGLGQIGFPMHMIEHSLSAMYNVAHGAGLSVVIPAWLQWKMKSSPQRITGLGKKIFDGFSGDSDDQAILVIEKLRHWFQQIDSPTTLQDLHIPTDDIPKIAANSLRLAKIWRLKEYDQETIENILHLCDKQ